MSSLNFVGKIYEKNKAIPICLEEVFFYLEERYKNLNPRSFQQCPGTSGQKVWNYCKKLCILKKKKISDARRYINQTTNEKFINDEEQVQAEIILCKIIDFKYLKFKSWISHFPGYQKYFKLSHFRRHYKMLHSIISN